LRNTPTRNRIGFKPGYSPSTVANPNHDSIPKPWYHVFAGRLIAEAGAADASAEIPIMLFGQAKTADVRGVTFRNRCDVLEITATTGHEVAKSTVSCSVTLATTNFRFRPKADCRDASTKLNIAALTAILSAAKKAEGSFESTSNVD
jgi:hypothetical protein